MEQFYTGDPQPQRPVEDLVVQPAEPHTETKIVTPQEVWERGYPLTVEEAQNVPLSLRPIRRLGQLAAYGKPFCLRQTGWSPLPQYMTRGDLVRVARHYEKAREMMDIVKAAEARGRDGGRTTAT